ncbi:MAG: 30S ribosomal protein S11 [Pseudomonadota bacterium]
MAAAQPNAKASARVRKRSKRSIAEGIVYIGASFNNTIISVADRQGNVLCQHSSGGSGFRGSRKSTPFAAQIAAEKAASKARDDFGMKSVTVIVKGPGPGRESSVRSFITLGFKIIEIIDGTGIPHNGCRAPKKRRV